jgi:hypothetical protein
MMLYVSAIVGFLCGTAFGWGLRGHFIRGDLRGTRNRGCQ